MQLITTKRFKSGGSVFLPGERIMVENEHLLLNQKIARRLTKAESKAVLSEYVDFAKSIFGEGCK